MKRPVKYCVTRRTRGWWWYARIWGSEWGCFRSKSLFKFQVHIKVRLYIFFMYGPGFKSKYER